MSEHPRPASIVIGTFNRGKLYEIKTILGDVGVQLKSLNDFDSVDVAPENEPSYLGNARAKAIFYAAATGHWVLADDSGLEVVALGGAPGVLSARYAGEGATDQQRREMVLSALRAVPMTDRGARFVCAVVIANPAGIIQYETEGTCEGVIAFAARGNNGFGYDPLFIPNGFVETFAELNDAEKNVISHRGRALAKAREFLTAESW